MNFTSPIHRRVLLSPFPARHLPRDLRPYLVLTPNRQAARALGVTFASLDHHARGLLRKKGLLVASELAEHRALKQAVLEGLAPADLEGTTRTVAATVREVLRAGLTASLSTSSLSERAKGILEVTHAHRELLRARGLVDPAEVMWLATEGQPQRQQVLVFGYPRLGLGDLVLLDRVAAPGSLLVLPWQDTPLASRMQAIFSLNETAAQTMVERGWEVERLHEKPESFSESLSFRFDQANEVTPECAALRFSSQEAEIRHVLTEVKALLHQGASPTAIALVARDEAAYAPLLKAVAWEYQIPLRVSYRVPLTETRVGAWIAKLITILIEDAPFEEMARLLAHPLCESLDADGWAHARKHHPSGLERWLALDERLACLAWPRQATRATHTSRLTEALELLGVAERAQRDPRDATALGKFGNALHGLADPADEELPLELFLAEVRELLALLTLPIDIGVKGVELHTPLALYGTRYDHVFVLGAAEGILPAPIQDDPVLDFFERKTLALAGLPLEGAVEAARREAISFHALLQTADVSLTMSYPEVLADQPRIESPYFAVLGLRPEATPVKTPASEEEFRRRQLRVDAGSDETLAAALRSWMVERRREGSEPCDHHDGVIGEGSDPEDWTFSASQLTTLGQCPFKWFAQRLLKLAEPAEADDDISPLLRGRLYHKTLERVLSRALGASDLRAAALQALDEAFKEAEESEVVPSLPTWPVRRQDHLRQLRQVILAESFLPEGTEVIALEQRFPQEDGQVVLWSGLRVRGVVDRVDRRDGKLVFIDYKTRATKPDGAKDERGKASLDVQLPLYLQAAGPALFPGEPIAEAQYYSLSKAEVIARVKLDEEALAAFIERVKAHLLEGAYPVEPDVEGRACATCDLDLVCRQGPRLERKAAGSEA
jgi:RecB family exonuclease